MGPRTATRTRFATLAETPRPLGFGKYFAEHMLVAEFQPEEGWGDARISPYGPLQIAPSASVLQYAQTVFEGLKAFRGIDGQIRIFRPEFHAKRLRQSASRLCLPSPNESQFTEWASRLIWRDRNWIPKDRGEALYLRPTIFGNEGFLGVRSSETAMFVIISSPVGNYYERGVQPLALLIEKSASRAAVGGIGAAKAGANYAASLEPSQRAKKDGFDQVLWLDGARHEEVEEVGTMNIFFRIGDEFVTPPLNGRILPGATRDCVITLLKERGTPVIERPLKIGEVAQASKEGSLKEIFGTGTAAIVSPVGRLSSSDGALDIRISGEMTTANWLRETILDIQTGVHPTSARWTVPVEEK